MTPPPPWTARHEALARLAQRQLFFVGGAPRSGTTWLQRMLDAHPDVSCRGEGLFDRTLAAPLDALLAQRRAALEAKNTAVFRETDGYPLPPPDHADILLGTAILLALHQQSAGRDCRALGEKNPENVFLYPRLRQLFPTARLICIARDPRDVLASAWHFFHRPAGQGSPGIAASEAARSAFVRGAIPSLVQGARSMLALAERHPQDCVIVTYEALLREPAPVLASLFRLLGVSDAPAVVQACLDRTSFAALTGGRPAGVAQDGAFLRKGVAGDWRATLTPAMGELVLQELGWMFPRFGWTR